MALLRGQLHPNVTLTLGPEIAQGTQVGGWVGPVDGWTNWLMDWSMDGWMDGDGWRWMDGWMDGWMDDLVK